MNKLYCQKFNPLEYLNLSPINILIYLVKEGANGCFSSTYQSINYFIYLKKGKIIYATNSLDPDERLERHIRLLGHQFSKLNSKLRKSIRPYSESLNNNFSEKTRDYHAIVWLIQENYLSPEQANILINNLINEIFETFLLFLITTLTQL